MCKLCMGRYSTSFSFSTDAHTKQYLSHQHAFAHCALCEISNSYTMGCPPVLYFSSWIILRTGGQTWYNYFIPPTSMWTLHIKRYFVLKLVRVV